MQNINDFTRRLSFRSRVDFCLLLLLLSITRGLLVVGELEAAA